MQTTQSVEKLGLQLMSRAKKALPTLDETQREQLLKGRFFQALLPRWQQKLGVPKVDESFTDLYNPARTAKRHDQQYRLGQESHESSRSKKHPSTDNPEVPFTSHESGEPSTQPRRRVSTLKCYGCGGLGHFRRNCPNKNRSAHLSQDKGDPPAPRDRSEAPGASPNPPGSKTATIEAGSSSSSHPPEDPVTGLSDEQLEEILKTRRCQ